MAVGGPSLRRTSVLRHPSSQSSVAMPADRAATTRADSPTLAKQPQPFPPVLSGASHPFFDRPEMARPTIETITVSDTRSVQTENTPKTSSNVKSLLKKLDRRINLCRHIVNFCQKHLSPEKYAARKLDKLDMLVSNIQKEVNANRVEWSQETKQTAIDMVAQKLQQYVKDLDNSPVLQKAVLKQASELLNKIDKVIVPESQFEKLTPEGFFTADQITMGDQKYMVGDQIGQGSFGKVYRCENAETGEKGVVKFMMVSDMTIDTIDALREVYTTQQFSGHRHIMSPTAVAITAMDDNDMQKLAIVMPEADRGDMEKVVGGLSETPLAERTSVLLPLLADAADGLTEMHSKGFAHRDIKPGNIFVKTDNIGEPVGMVGDLGISRHESDFGSIAMGGTIPYMPADSHVGLSVDSYAFGMMVFELLSGGSFPFLETPEAVFDGKSEVVMPDSATLKSRIDERVSTASDELKSLIQRSLSAVPEDRPTMREWRDILTQ